MLRWHTNVNYNDLRYNLILNEETINRTPNTNPYLDSVGIPTIGIGFNLRDRADLSAVLSAMQITDAAS